MIKTKQKKSFKWIQKSKVKKGRLRAQLGIEKDDKIPTTLLHKIVDTKSKKIKNPTKEGKKRIPVTRLLKKRANFALNVRK